MTCVAIGLVIAGGLLEFVGVLAVWREIGRDVAHARGLLDSHAVTLPPREERSRRVNPYDTRRSQLAGRGASVSLRSIELLANRINNALGELEERMDDGDDDLFNELLEEMVEGDNDVRADLRNALAGNTRARYRGVVALAVGIVLTTAGGALGALA